MDGWMEGWMEGVGREERQLDGWVTHTTSLNGADDEALTPGRDAALCVSRGALPGQGSGWGRTPVASWLSPQPRLPALRSTFCPRPGLTSHFLWAASLALPAGVAFVFLPLLSSLLKDLGGPCAPSWRRDSEAPLCLVTC